MAALGANAWASYQYAEGDGLVRRQEYAQAHRHYVNCLIIWRWSADTQLAAGRAARRAFMNSEAEYHFERCLSLSGRNCPRAAAVALERLLMQAQEGDLVDIEGVLWDKVKREVPETQPILEALATGYLHAYRLAPAMKCLRMILERDPNNVDALFHRGWLAERSGGAMNPLKDYVRALDLRPDRDDIRLAIAQLLGRKNPAVAIGYYEYLIVRQPENPDVVLGLAHCYQAAGQTDGLQKAAALVDRLLRKDPGNSRALSEKGVVLVAQGNVAEGEALLRRALDNEPSNFDKLDIHYQLYSFLRQQPGREAEADAQREIFERIKSDRARLDQIASRDLSKSPLDPDLHYEMGTLWYRNGKIDQGMRWLLSAVKLDPTHELAQRALADHFKRVGDSASGEKHRLQSSDAVAKKPGGKRNRRRRLAS